MPKNPTPGLKGYHLELDPAVMERIKDLAQRNGRSMRDEAEHALIRHLATPPTVHVEAAPLPPVEVTVAKKPRGRPRKGAHP